MWVLFVCFFKKFSNFSLFEDMILRLEKFFYVINFYFSILFNWFLGEISIIYIS